MYLEPVRSVGATGIKITSKRVQCRDGTYDVDNGVVAPCRTRGGVMPNCGAKPKAGYVLNGKKSGNSYVYPACKMGYVQAPNFMPHPQGMSCFDPRQEAYNQCMGIAI